MPDIILALVIGYAIDLVLGDPEPDLYDTRKKEEDQGKNTEHEGLKIPQHELAHHRHDDQYSEH